MQRARPIGWAKAATVAAILATIVIIGLVTMGKAVVDVGGLWEAEEHRVRSVDLVLFNGFIGPSTWWAPWVNLLGNAALFVPLGLLTVFTRDLFGSGRGSAARNLLWGGAAGLAVSLLIEVLQYFLALGYSDVDDLLYNTVGAVLGAGMALLLNRRWRFSVTAATLLLGVVVIVVMASGLLGA